MEYENATTTGVVAAERDLWEGGNVGFYWKGGNDFARVGKGEGERSMI